MKCGKARIIIENIFSAITIIYTIWYMHLGICYKNSGALSKIGLSHHTFFVIWGVMTYIALALGIFEGYKRYTKNKVYISMLVISLIGMILTLTNDFDYMKKTEYYLHCAGSLTFSAIMGITIFLLFLLCYKKDKIFKAFTYLSGGILVIDLICLLIFKETGLIEALPIFAGYIMLGIVNLRGEKIEVTR